MSQGPTPALGSLSSEFLWKHTARHGLSPVAAPMQMDVSFSASSLNILLAAFCLLHLGYKLSSAEVPFPVVYIAVGVVVFIPFLSFCVLSGSSGFKRSWSQTGHQGQSLTYTAKQMDPMRLCVREFSNEEAKMRRKPDSRYLSLQSNFICLEKTITVANPNRQ